MGHFFFQFNRLTKLKKTILQLQITAIFGNLVTSNKYLNETANRTVLSKVIYHNIGTGNENNEFHVVLIVINLFSGITTIREFFRH